MKKVFGIFRTHLMFSISSPSFANDPILDSRGCFDYAIRSAYAEAAATAIGDLFGLNHYNEYRVFQIIYDICAG